MCPVWLPCPVSLQKAVSSILHQQNLPIPSSERDYMSEHQLFTIQQFMVQYIVVLSCTNQEPRVCSRRCEEVFCWWSFLNFRGRDRLVSWDNPRHEINSQILFRRNLARKIVRAWVRTGSIAPASPQESKVSIPDSQTTFKADQKLQRRR